MFKVEIEGIDGCGKTTLLNNIAKVFTHEGLRVALTREVGNTHDQAAVELRKIILNPLSKMEGKEMELVFASMRLMNQRWLKENENNFDMCLNDRGILSHYAYTDHNVSPKFTNDLYMGFLSNYTEFADLILRVKVAPEVALARRDKRNGFVDAIEAKGPEYQKAVSISMDHYIEYHNNEYSSFMLANKAVIEIDGNATPEGMTKQAVDAIKTVRRVDFSENLL